MNPRATPNRGVDPFLELYIVKIPCLKGTTTNRVSFTYPADMTQWQWIKITLTTSSQPEPEHIVPRCYSNTLRDLNNESWARNLSSVCDDKHECKICGKIVKSLKTFKRHLKQNFDAKY